MPQERIFFFQLIPSLALGTWCLIQIRIPRSKNVAVEYDFFRLEPFVFSEAAKLYDCSKAVVIHNAQLPVSLDALDFIKGSIERVLDFERKLDIVTGEPLEDESS